MFEFELGHIHKGEFRMAKKRFQAEQIIGKLREAEVEIIAPLIGYNSGHETATVQAPNAFNCDCSALSRESDTVL
jgi:hypothetical protein